MRIKRGPIAVAVILGGIGAFYGIKSCVGTAGPSTAPVAPKAVALPEAPKAATVSVAKMALPSATPARKGTDVRVMEWAWNAQMALNGANGGVNTTEGSLMAAHGINLHFTREDDTGKMAAQLANLATALAKGQDNPTDGVHFITLMGDGTPSWFQGTNERLKNICSDCTAEGVGILGYSRGEDKFMGPKEWADNPKAALGGVVIGVIGDGDWNIVQKWIADNSGLANNPDTTTFDPDAINWIAVDDYNKAAQRFVTGACEDRPVSHKGHRVPGQTQHGCAQAVVTWTPGDVVVAKQKGGVVTIASTKEYNTQMPCTLIGIRKWDRAHRDIVKGVLKASFDEADQIRNYPEQLTHAGDISAAIYASSDPEESRGAYWVKYFNGATEQDKTGVPISLGGSSVADLADELQYLGLAPGSKNLFEFAYTTFGDIAVLNKLIPKYPKASDVFDTSYVEELAREAPPTTTSTDVPTFKPAAAMTQVTAKKAWSINFQTGSAELAPDAITTMKALERDLIITDLRIEVDGHTDNTGDQGNNQTLSEARAKTVKEWLKHESATNFFDDRFIVKGYGQDKPVATNDTDTGRAKNRRVEIKMGE
jgi:outer membrane protein OmpA-like peptidoglycan-associated protein